MKKLLITLPAILALAIPASAQVIDQNQPNAFVYMKAFGQSDCAQSFQQTASNIAGAGIHLYTTGSSGTVTLEIWDALPNAGGNMIVSGSAPGTPGNWVDIYWTPTPITSGVTYYMVMTCTDPAMGIYGDVNDPYPFGMVFANPGYGAFPTFDYTFRTYSGNVGPTLSVVGTCGQPGSGVQATNMTPNGAVGFAASPNAAGMTVPAGGCGPGPTRHRPEPVRRRHRVGGRQRHRDGAAGQRHPVGCLWLEHAVHRPGDLHLDQRRGPVAQATPRSRAPRQRPGRPSPHPSTWAVGSGDS